MNIKNVIIRNSLIGFASQLITIIFTFLTRNLFIKFIGVELLGVNSTFASVLNTLSLAELGFQSAITYSLYNPLHNQLVDEINDIMNILKIIYRYVGLFFVISPLVALPFMPFIITDIDFSSEFYFYFILQASASSFSYFLAYKRAILYADQKDYISKVIDMANNIVFNIIQCLILIHLQNYILYLSLKIIQICISNLIVHIYCLKHYSYLHKSAINIIKLKEIWENVKNIFIGKIASYIHGSTDNLVISVFVSTISVGYFVNYTTVTTSMKMLTKSILSPMIPIIGRFLVGEDDSKGREKALLLYTHARYLITMFVLIPLLVLIDCFISLWIGSKMLLPQTITILLGLDFYIDLVHSATSDFINGAGLFHAQKYVELAGAISNIVFSIILGIFWGIEGILIGTIFSQIVFWIGRSYIAYFQCLQCSLKHYFRYWVKNVLYFIAFMVAYSICNYIFSIIRFNNNLFEFIIGGIVCIFILAIYVLVIFNKSKEQKYLLNIGHNFFEKRYVRGQ